MRVLVGYEPTGDDVIEDIPLHGVNLSFLQQLFDIPEENPIYDCYRLSDEQLSAIQSFIAEPGKEVREDLEYYLEYYG